MRARSSPASGEGPLWQAVVTFLVEHNFAIEVWSRDRPRIEETLAELYLVGEHPSVDDVRVFLDEAGWYGPGWRREFVRLWRRRLADPARRASALAAGSQWVRPFWALERAAATRGLRPIPERLVDALAAGAREYLRAAAARPPAPAATRTAEEVLLLTSRAVRLWAASRIEERDDDHWPSVLAARRDLLR